jgi:hypothetical protein
LNGTVLIDIDNVCATPENKNAKKESMDHLKEILLTNTNPISIFSSVSGNGLKIIFNTDIEMEIKNNNDVVFAQNLYHGANKYIADELKKILKLHIITFSHFSKLKVDIIPLSVGTFFSYDENMFIKNRKDATCYLVRDHVLSNKPTRTLEKKPFLEKQKPPNQIFDLIDEICNLIEENKSFYIDHNTRQILGMFIFKNFDEETSIRFFKRMSLANHENKGFIYNQFYEIKIENECKALLKKKENNKLFVSLKKVTEILLFIKNNVQNDNK